MIIWIFSPSSVFSLQENFQDTVDPVLDSLSAVTAAATVITTVTTRITTLENIAETTDLLIQPTSIDINMSITSPLIRIEKQTEKSFTSPSFTDINDGGDDDDDDVGDDDDEIKVCCWIIFYQKLTKMTS